MMFVCNPDSELRSCIGNVMINLAEDRNNYGTRDEMGPRIIQRQRIESGKTYYIRNHETVTQTVL